MNITPINSIESQNKFKNLHYNNQMNIIKTKPYAIDSISFTGTEKMLASRVDGISLQVAMDINSQVQPLQKKVHKFISKIFGDFCATDLNPMNNVYALKDRAKKALSIVEKSATRQWNDKTEVLNYMTDLNGAKIVMRDSSQKSVEKVLARLIQPIKEGKIELLEIENKRPIIVKGQKGLAKTQYDYANENFLEKLVQIQENKWAKLNLKEKRYVNLDLNDYTKVNYTAIHMLLKFPEEDRPFELMIMGEDVNRLKDLDDKFFKILNKKNIDPMYQPLVDIIKPLAEQGNENLLKKFNKYRGDAFLFQRGKQPRPYTKEDDNMVYFLPLSNDLPDKYDLNNLYKMMKKCESDYEHKNKKESDSSLASIVLRAGHKITTMIKQTGSGAKVAGHKITTMIKQTGSGAKVAGHKIKHIFTHTESNSQK